MNAGRGRIAVLTGESACPTWLGQGLHRCGAGAFACQLIFSHLLTVAALTGVTAASNPSRDRQGAVAGWAARVLVISRDAPGVMGNLC
jgi:hypothetical protein